MMATILDSLLGSCANKLQEIIIDEAILILGVEEELAKLQGRIPLIQCCLVDAERRRTEEPAVNIWLGQLRDAMYDVDVITDLARFKGSKLLPDHPSSSSSRSAACSVLSLSSCFSNIGTRREVAVKIRSLNKKIENISKDMIFFKFVSTQPAVAGQGSTSKQRKSGNLVEPNLVGKETLRACTRLVEQVLAHKEKKDYKLGIVGTGGVGKTTLAQKIYNDLKGSFSSQAWICVSQEYSEVALMKEILRNIGVHHEQDETIGELSSKLEAAIRDKSFFLVLDDVWQHDVWTSLLRVPLHAASTRIILVTTRHDTVAHAIGVEDVHRVDLMPVDVGWELLWKSMNINEEKYVQHLRDIGKDIVRKCGGLPLAIKVTSSVLATKEKTESEWTKFIDRSAWSMGNLPTELRGALYLSYDDLPYMLKQCFLYCATFPEDCSSRWRRADIKVPNRVLYQDDLVRLWVAEGFVEEQQGQLLEDTAEEYYYELIHRNLLQPDPFYFDHTRCKMHDLVRQLACYLSREECFVGDPGSLGALNMSEIRRLTVVTKKDTLVLPCVYKREVKVRTFRTDTEPRKVEDIIFKIFPYLRVLDLTGSSIQTIPGCIRNLIHLRLLDLDDTEISCLPECIGSLINLQILNLQRCKALHCLPSAITQLCNLRRLGLRDTPINQVPKGIGRLKFLNDLEGFPIGGGSDNAKTQDGWELEELGHLSQLRRLVMVRLERVAPSCTSSLLTDKEYLKVLNLQCTKRTDEPCSEEDINNIEKIFEQLKPPQSLEGLDIKGFFGQRYPTWLCTNHLSSVKLLNLIDCKSCVHLPPIGQLPNLRYLQINGAAAVTRIRPEIVGCGDANPRSTDVVAAFPKLESLVIRDMPNWEEWCLVEEEDAAAAAAATEGGEDGSVEIRKGEASSPRMQLLPRLRRLALVNCPKLRALPRQLGQEASCLKDLQLRGARCLKVVEDLPFLSEVLVISRCEGLERVTNLPRVRELRINRCPQLRCVEGLGGLQQLWLDEGMKEISSLWVPGLQQQRQQLHAEDVDVYTW